MRRVKGWGLGRGCALRCWGSGGLPKLRQKKNQFCAKNYAILNKFWYFFPILQQKVGDYPPVLKVAGPIQWLKWDGTVWNGVPPARRILAKRSACLMPRHDLRPAAPRSTVPAPPQSTLTTGPIPLPLPPAPTPMRCACDGRYRCCDSAGR